MDYVVIKGAEWPSSVIDFPFIQKKIRLMLGVEKKGLALQGKRICFFPDIGCNFFI